MSWQRWCLTWVGMFAIIVPSLAQQFAYAVYFRDKQGSLSFSDSSRFLSARALQRRAVQSIRIDSSDLPVSQAYVDSVMRISNGVLHGKSKWLNLCVVLITDTNSLVTLRAKSYITRVQLVGSYATRLHNRQTNTEGNPKWKNSIRAKSTAFNAGYFGGTWAQTQLVKGQYLHEKGFAGKGKHIAVFDGGFTAVNTHRGFDSLRFQNRIIDVHNFVLDTNTVYTYDDHGMAALSTMAANVVDTFVGAAPQAQYALYVTEDGQSEQLIELYNFLLATERCDSIGIDVISCSLGYNTFDNPDDDLVFSRDCDGRTTVAAKAVNMASAKGMIVVTSAGNDGLSPWGKVLTPGDADSALTIGSVTGNGSEVYSSGKGPNASGVVKPDVCALGELSAVLTLSGYGQRAGTSFATPQIAGWVASIWGAIPTVKASVIRKAIRSCASQYNSPTAQMGYGIPDMQCVGIQLAILQGSDTSNLYNDITLPFQPNRAIFLDVKAQQATQLQYVLCDITGRVLGHQILPIAEGKQRLIISDVADFPTGMYILSAQMGQEKRVFKIIKM